MLRRSKYQHKVMHMPVWLVSLPAAHLFHIIKEFMMLLLLILLWLGLAMLAYHFFDLFKRYPEDHY